LSKSCFSRTSSFVAVVVPNICSSMTGHRTLPICYMSAKKIAVCRTCEALIMRTRTAESRFSVILTFCTPTDGAVSEQAALHASTAGNPHAQRRTSAHRRKT
jgi:hypothetical protein